MTLVSRCRPKQSHTPRRRLVGGTRAGRIVDPGGTVGVHNEEGQDELQAESTLPLIERCVLQRFAFNAFDQGGASDGSPTLGAHVQNRTKR